MNFYKIDPAPNCKATIYYFKNFILEFQYRTSHSWYNSFPLKLLKLGTSEPAGPAQSPKLKKNK